jgi:hypothetical protein
VAITLVAAFFRLYRIMEIPPGDGDDAAHYGVDALRILDGEFPIFFTTNFGREAMFSYLVAACVALFGVGPHAMHIAAAIVGILTVPAVYFATEELLRDEKGALRKVGGLMVALVTAISYWHLNWSRTGLRVILVPPFTAAIVGFLWRALRTGSRRDFVLAGAFLGLSIYTYQAARILPVLVVAAFAYTAAARRKLSRQDVTSLALVALVSALVFAPLGIYFVTHPGTFAERIGNTFVLGESGDEGSALQQFAAQLGNVLLFLNFRGDGDPILTIPGRPSLNGFLSVLFFVGLLVSMRNIRKPVYAFILTWLVVMSVPAMVAGGDATAKRALGAFQAVMMLVAIGTLAPLDALRRWSLKEGLGWDWTDYARLGVFLAAAFAYSGWLTYRDYFVVWGGDPDLFTHYESGLAAIGRYVATVPRDERVYISPVRTDHPSMRYNSENHPGIVGYNGRTCFVAPERAQQDTTYVIVPGDDKQGLDALAETFPEGSIVAEGPVHYGLPYFNAFHVPAGAGARLAPAQPVSANWQDEIGLLGYTLNADAFSAGDTLELHLFYRSLAKMDADYIAFVHLLGPDNPATGNALWAQHDAEPCQTFYATSRWHVGEIVRDDVTLTIPDDAPPGTYELQTGFYTWPEMQRLSVLDEEGRPVSTTVLLGQVAVAGEP